MDSIFCQSANPVVYFPWEPDYITTSTHHQLFAGRRKFRFWTNSSDDPNISFVTEDIFRWNPKIGFQEIVHFGFTNNTKSLAKNLVSRDRYGPFQCFVLSLFDPIKPHLKPVRCSKNLLYYWFCEHPPDVDKNATFPEIGDVKERYGLLMCSGGQYISTLSICDGHKDCPDGKDESGCSNLYSQFVSHGRQKYTNLHNCSANRNPEKEDLNSKVDNYFCENSKTKILVTMVNDLIFDCPYHDDEYELLSLTQATEEPCKFRNLHPCYLGHSQCFKESERCIYNLTKEGNHLMNCRNGKHLQNCEPKVCSGLYKCGYCVPNRYVCDGKWDCWNGGDEQTCVSYSCHKMFKCKMSSICIHTKNVCDQTADCPMKEDEFACQIHSCVGKCHCLNHGIKCDHQNFLAADTFFKLRYFIFIDISINIMSGVKLNELVDTQILLAHHNNLTEAFLCDSRAATVEIKLLDLSHNQISLIEPEHFSCIPQVQDVILKDNRISDIAHNVFRNSSKLNSLNIANNNLTCLKQFSLFGIGKLHLIYLLGNGIQHVTKELFSGTNIRIILTDSFHLCCMNDDPGSVCTSKPPWPMSSNALLSSVGVKVVSWFLSTSISATNLIAVCKLLASWRKSHKLSVFKKYVIRINFCDLLVGLFLLTITVEHTITGDRYVESDMWWRQGIVCHTAAFVSLWSVLVEAWFMFFVSVARFRVVKDPFEKPFGKKVYLFSVVFFPLILGLVIFLAVILRKEIEGFPSVSLPICVLLGKTDQSISQSFVIVFSPVYLLTLLIFTIVFYSKLVKENAKSNTVLSEGAKMGRQRAVTQNAVFAGFAMTISWIPASIFYLVTAFVTEYPISALYWTTLVLLPLNALLNPLVFNLSDIRNLLSRTNPKIKVKSPGKHCRIR